MNAIYDTLNDKQREAVFTTEGPVLVLAGAGSGKTRALTHRIAYLIEEKHVMPWNIMAITFTNKAAAEMRERVDDLVGADGNSVWVATFHSSCVRILRRHADLLGYSNNFTIYDTDDQKTLMRQILKKLDLDPKLYKDRAILSRISAAKNELISSAEFQTRSAGNFREGRIADIYTEYEAQLKNNNAMDFDDLLVRTVELFENYPDVLEEYQRRFRYILVDEYQDTNTAQFKIVWLLAKQHRNLCVVGDDDQSIYKFRGADITNILNFEKSFPGASVTKLEQNYRSTKNILAVANGVIRHNHGRKDKVLWTDNEEGDKVNYIQYDTAYDEAYGIVKDIEEHRNTFDYKDCAVLYRTNAQSRVLEEKFVANNIPYRLVGGVNFYQRKEIKDLICYLKTVANGRDDLAVQRIINVPRRGIGATSISKVMTYADQYGMSFYDALTDWEHIPSLGRAGAKIAEFVHQIQVLRSQAQFLTVKDLLEHILDDTGYRAELNAEKTIESQTRLENLQELINKAADLHDEPEDAEALDRFLEEVALVAEVDSLDEDENRVVLMTLHSAKGLEFPRVYLSGMEDGLFPSMMSIKSEDDTDLEEERRLCYVGITRARQKLTLTSARTRMINGETHAEMPSRFIKEIPPLLLDVPGRAVRKPAGSAMGAASSSMRPGAPTASGMGTSSFGGTGSSEPAHLGSYRPRPNVLNKKSSAAYMGKEFKVEKAGSLNYGKGDRVRHMKFGEGTVLEIENGKRDYEITVSFDQAGVKKLFASFAKLEKL